MIQLSSTALAEVNRLRSKAAASDRILRIRITSGGCMDWCYCLSLCAEVSPDDVLIDHKGMQIVVDTASLTKIEDLSIDYSEDLMGGGFRFRNPKATQSCSCGSSFQC